MSKQPKATAAILVLGLYMLSICVGLISVFGMLSGCRSVRPVISQETHVSKKDSVRDDLKTAVSRKDSTYYYEQRHDTAVGITGSRVGLVLAEADRDKDTTLRSGNARLHQYTDQKGQRHTDCECDSLTIVVADLLTERNFQWSTEDSLRSELVYQQSTRDSTHTQVITISSKPKHLGFFGRIKAFVVNIFWYLAAAVIGILVWEIGKKLFSIAQIGLHGRF